MAPIQGASKALYPQVGGRRVPIPSRFGLWYAVCMAPRTPIDRVRRAEYNRRYLSTPGGRAKQAECAARWKASPEGRRAQFEHMLRNNYAIDSQDWAIMYNEQRGKCAICSNSLGFDNKTHVDHCHRTGWVRALLCSGCNTALGKVERVGVSKFSAYIAEHARIAALMGP